MKPHPDQNIITKEKRFKVNHLVRYLLDNHRNGLNQLSTLPNIPQEDWDQLYQLIGTTIGGYYECSLVSDKAKDRVKQLVKNSNENKIFKYKSSN